MSKKSKSTRDATAHPGNDTPASTTGVSIQRSPQLTPEGHALLINHFNHVEQQVSLAINTGVLIVAANTLLISAYFTVAKDWAIYTKHSDSWASIVFSVSGFYLLEALLLSLIAVFPNVKSTPPADVWDVFFFGKIAAAPEFKHYERAFRDADSRQELEREMAFQIWGKSRFLRGVFEYIQASLACTWVAAAALAVAYWLIRN